MAAKIPFLTVMFLLSSLLGVVYSMGLDVDLEDDARDLDDDDRAIIVATGLNFGNVLGLNLTSLIPLLALAAAALLPLLCLCALAFAVLWHLVDNKNSGYGMSSGGYSTNTYSEYARAFGLDDLDWEKFSILDWVSIGQEAYRSFDSSNFDCQKRTICEVHQNVQKFGSLASKFVSLFEYLQYTELFALPEAVKSIIYEYQDAADTGRNLRKDCGEIYSDCGFSINKLYDKYSVHENSI